MKKREARTTYVSSRFRVMSKRRPWKPKYNIHFDIKPAVDWLLGFKRDEEIS